MLQKRKILRTIFAQWICLLYQAQKYTWKIKYTLRDEKIHDEQIEPSFNLIHPCNCKLCLVFEAPVDFIPNDLHSN